jgi:uncharacterized repeat protein (TIGR02543 family)
MSGVTVYLLMKATSLGVSLSLLMFQCAAFGQGGYQALMNGAYVVPPSASAGNAVGTVTLVSNQTAISVDLIWQNLNSMPMSAYIAGPAGPGTNAAALFYLSMSLGLSGSTTGQVFSVTPTQVGYLTNGLLYMQITTEVRGQLYPTPVFWTLNTSTNGKGTVSPTGGLYTNGTVVMVTATPAQKHSFVGWSGAASGTQNPLSLTMTNNKSVTAHFQFVTNLAPTLAELAIRLSWLAQTNENYQVQAASELDTNNWVNLGPVVPGNGTTNQYIDLIGNNPRRFYRVITHREEW